MNKKRNPNTPKQSVYKKWGNNGEFVEVIITNSSIEAFAESPVYLHIYHVENELLDYDLCLNREQFKALLDHLQLAYEEAYG